jgi:uncharacterized membrane protein HdeD (DUF308 family)
MMKKLQGWAAIILGGLVLFNIFNIMSVISLALGVAAIVAATVSFVTRLRAGRFSINSLLVASLGLALVLNQEATLQSLVQVLALIIAAIGVSNLWQYRRRLFPREQARFAIGALAVTGAVVLLLFPGFPLTLIRILMGLGLLGYGALRLATKTVVLQQFTWNETIRKYMEDDQIQDPNIIDVEVEEDSSKKS